MKSLNLLFVFLLVLITYSCTPYLNMSIEPTTVCPGEEFEVEWKSAEVPPPTVETSNPTDPPFSGELSNEGKIKLKADVTTRITMTSTHEGELFEKIIDVHVIADNELRPLTFEWSGCIVAQGERVGYKPLSDHAVSSSVMVKEVTNTSGRHIIIQHNGGRSIPLEPGEITNAFNTYFYKGEWSVEIDKLRDSPVLPPFTQEGCPLDETSPFPSITYLPYPTLTVSITIGC